MVDVIREIIQKIAISLALTAILSMLAMNLLHLGESSFQSLGVIFFIIYTVVSLFTFSRHKLFFVLSVPIFAQFFHIFQRYHFSTGGNSLWRLIPFIILDTYLVHFLASTPRRSGGNYSVVILIWLISSSLFLAISPNLSQIVFGGIVMYVLTIPLLFVYLHTAAQATDFSKETEKYVSILFVLFCLGSIGLVYLGAGYKGTDNLWATRNIADTNTTMAYFILLWPFSIQHAVKAQWSALGKIALTALFLAIVTLSFSRGALLIVLPYILLTCMNNPGFINFKWIIPLGVSVCFYFSDILTYISQLDLMYFWTLRFADIGSFSVMVNNLDRLSGRSEIHETAYQLFKQKPLFGHGTGSFEVLGPGYREAHSLWFTLLAEQGMMGVTLIYSLLCGLLFTLIRNRHATRNTNFLLSLIFFLIFNHTVGSTFVILTGKSISINCIAPMLLLVIYFHSKSQKEGENSIAATI
jgi:O-antigen ligase